MPPKITSVGRLMPVPSIRTSVPPLGGPKLGVTPMRLKGSTAGASVTVSVAWPKLCSIWARMMAVSAGVAVAKAWPLTSKVTVTVAPVAPAALVTVPLVVDSSAVESRGTGSLVSVRRTVTATAVPAPASTLRGLRLTVIANPVVAPDGGGGFGVRAGSVGESASQAPSIRANAATSASCRTLGFLSIMATLQVPSSLGRQFSVELRG